MQTEAEILKDVPSELQGALSYYAYTKYHAYGQEEVHNALCGLVAELLPSLRAFEARVRAEAQ